MHSTLEAKDDELGQLKVNVTTLKQENDALTERIEHLEKQGKIELLLEWNSMCEILTGLGCFRSETLVFWKLLVQYKLKINFCIMPAADGLFFKNLKLFFDSWIFICIVTLFFFSIYHFFFLEESSKYSTCFW